MRKVVQFFACTLLVFVLFSCKKESPTYTFTVHVVNEEGIPLPNMYVEATADVPNTLADFTGTTDEDGSVTFTYEYEAVLKIRATRGSNPPTWMGCNFVKLEADNTVIITVVAQPYDPTQPGC